ncbi:MAG TPA: hypothetical protein EYN66_14250 [Myxococcales bacterium]|nr:hypothetical protein [Myxococcales bacterium]
MARKGAPAGLGLAALGVALIYLVRELKEVVPAAAGAVVTAAGDVTSGITDAAKAAAGDTVSAISQSGEYYGRQAAAALAAAELDARGALAATIGERQAVAAVAAGRTDYGTVTAGGRSYTGRWEVSEYERTEKAPDSCHVVHATAHSSNAWTMFTGPMCRQARAQGLIA